MSGKTLLYTILCLIVKIILKELLLYKNNKPIPAVSSLQKINVIIIIINYKNEADPICFTQKLPGFNMIHCFILFNLLYHWNTNFKKFY